jgi:nitrogen fixation protein NifU and related proteins
MVMSQESYKDQSNAVVMEKMLADSGYSDRAIRYYMEKPYMGAILDADQVSEMTGTCGDTMRISLKVENGVILFVRSRQTGASRVW